jgi:hypothetical protein
VPRQNEAENAKRIVNDKGQEVRPLRPDEAVDAAVKKLMAADMKRDYKTAFDHVLKYDTELKAAYAKPAKQEDDERADITVDRIVRRAMAKLGVTYKEAFDLEMTNPANAELKRRYAFNTGGAGYDR